MWHESTIGSGISTSRMPIAVDRHFLKSVECRGISNKIAIRWLDDWHAYRAKEKHKDAETVTKATALPKWLLPCC